MSSSHPSSASASVSSVPHAVVDSALAFLAQRPWDEITLARLARRSHVPLAAVQKHFSAAEDILDAIAQKIDTEVATRICRADFSAAAPAERLFDVVMARFDVLQEHRAAMLTMMAHHRTNSRAALAKLMRLQATMDHTLRLAHCDAFGGAHRRRTATMTLIFLMLLRVWENDSSTDLSKTMAAVDRHTRLFCRIFGL